MSKFKFGSLSIDPVEYGSQGNAILGIRGSGKTYTATAMAEKLFDAGIPFVVFDPIGVWRFLRVPGKGPGYKVVVAGGEQGDLPLTVSGAAEIVRAAMKNGVSLVIDLFDINLSKADWKRIVTSCVKVLLHENSQHGLRHIFIEEAAEFAPQRVGPDQGQVYAEIEKLARMGGNARLGYTLINQRAEEVNKAVLELCDTLFLHRQKGRNSLTAASKWLDIGNVTEHKKIISSLSTLPTGQCWAWMSGTEEPVLIKVPTKNSLHPDRTVMRDGKLTIKKGVDVHSFVEDMRGSLADLEKHAAENDPDKLKKKIRELEAQLKGKVPVAPKVDLRALYTKGYNACLEDHSMAFEAAMATLAAKIFREINEWRIPKPKESKLSRASLKTMEIEIQDPPPNSSIGIIKRQMRETHDKIAANVFNDGISLNNRTHPTTGPQLKVLRALHFWNSLGIVGPSREQVAFVAGYSPTSSTFANLIGAMRTDGKITYPEGGLIQLVVCEPELEMGASEAQQVFARTLKGPQRKVLDAFRNSRDPMTREEIAERAGYSATSSTWTNIIGSLRTLSILQYPSPGYIKISDWVWEILDA